MTLKNRTIMAFAAVYLIWGSTYLGIRFTLETLPPLLSAGLRFFLAGTILYAIARFKQKAPAPTMAHWKSAAFIGACLVVGGNGSVVLAERYVPSGIAALMIATTPLWMVILQWLWHRGRRPSLGVWIGIAIGFLGVTLLVLPDSSQGHAIHLGGALTLVLAAMSWSVGSVYSRKAPHPDNPFLATSLQMLTGGALLFLVGFLRGESSMVHFDQFSAKSIGAFFYLLIAGSLIGFTAYIWLLKNVGIAKASTYAFVNPVVAVFLGCVLAQEPLSPRILLAAALVLVAVIFITTTHKESDPAENVS